MNIKDTLTETLEELDIFEGEEVELSQTNTTNNKLLNWGFRWQKHNELKEVQRMKTEKENYYRCQDLYKRYEDNTEKSERFFSSAELYDMTIIFKMWVIESAMNEIALRKWWQGKSLWQICDSVAENELHYQNDLIVAQQEARDIDG